MAPDPPRMDFLIRRRDHGDWDDVALDPAVCRPTTIESRPAPQGDVGFIVDDTIFEFIYEMPGIQVVICGGTLDRAAVTRVLEDVCRRMGEATGTPGYVLDLHQFGDAPIRL